METFVISRDAFEFDGHRAHSVTDRATRRLIGHVAQDGDCWAFLPVTAERGGWLTGVGHARTRRPPWSTMTLAGSPSPQRTHSIPGRLA
jgi:hypothetical protein